MEHPFLGLAPLLEVKDCERAIEFYNRLGLTVVNSTVLDGKITWAALRGGRATLMIGRYDQLEEGKGQHAMIYLYVENVAALHSRLCESGMRVSELKYPEYMPSGEFSVCDENGYLIFMAQPDGDVPGLSRS